MLKKCPKCNNTHTKGGLFCSRSCANSRSFSEESKIKKSTANKKFYQSLSEQDKEQINARLKSLSLNTQGYRLELLLSKEFETLAYQSKRKRVLIEQEFKCNNCKIDTWFGKPLTLELDHVDGDHQNDLRSNLVALCPNCHSLTETWRGRNRKNKLPPVAQGEQVVL